MGTTCSKCGNTRSPAGATTCSVCGAALPGPSRPAAPGSPPGSFPVLVTATGRRYRLSPAGETLVGSQGCAITLTDPGVAPRHASIAPASGGFVIADMGGGVIVNGNRITSPYALQPGDRIVLGTAQLVYQGPAAAPLAVAPPPPPPPKIVTPPPPLVVAPPPPRGSAPPFPLRAWPTAPTTEGEVKLVDGPHQIDKGNLVAKMGMAAALAIIAGPLAFLPFMGKRENPGWFLRIHDCHQNKDVSVLMVGQPSSLPQLGDWLAVWGQVKEGNVVMDRGYSYNTDSEIRLKR